MVEIITEATAEFETPVFKRYSTREVVWCDFHENDVTLHPEFIGRHPAIVVSKNNRSNQPLLVIPVTSQPQNEDDPCCHKLSKNYWKSDKAESWAICSHVYAVSHLRVSRAFKYTKRVTQEDYRDVLTGLTNRLPMSVVF